MAMRLGTPRASHPSSASPVWSLQSWSTGPVSASVSKSETCSGEPARLARTDWSRPSSLDMFVVAAPEIDHWSPPCSACGNCSPEPAWRQKGAKGPTPFVACEPLGWHARLLPRAHPRHSAEFRQDGRCSTARCKRQVGRRAAALGAAPAPSSPQHLLQLAHLSSSCHEHCSAPQTQQRMCPGGAAPRSQSAAPPHTECLHVVPR